MKILINIRKGRLIYRKSFTPRRLTNFIKSKANSLLKKGATIAIKVTYAKGYTNEILHCSLEDLIYARQAFVQEYL